MIAKTTLTTVLTSAVMGLATLAAGLMTAAPAWAQVQAQTQTQTQPPVDRVVVTGKRLTTPAAAKAPAAEPVTRIVVVGKRLPPAVQMTDVERVDAIGRRLHDLRMPGSAPVVTAAASVER